MSQEWLCVPSKIKPEKEAQRKLVSESLACTHHKQLSKRKRPKQEAQEREKHAEAPQARVSNKSCKQEMRSRDISKIP